MALLDAPRRHVLEILAAAVLVDDRDRGERRRLQTDGREVRAAVWVPLDDLDRLPIDESVLRPARRIATLDR
jgi:hypothetical protein